MNCRVETLSLMGAIILLPCTGFGQTQVPNDFQAGQPARAADVNENFDTLESAIDQNLADIQEIQGLSGLSREAAQIKTGLDLVSGLRWLVADFYLVQGTMPTDNAQTGAAAPAGWSNKYVESATITNGVIEIAFRSNAAPQIASRTVILNPVDPGTQVIWFDCLGDGISDAYLAELDCAFSDDPYPPIYDVRQQVLTAFDVLKQSNALQLIQDYYNANGVWPSDNPQAGLDAPFNYRNNYVESLSVSASGIVTIAFGRNSHAILTGTWMTWTPVDRVGTIDWTCRGEFIALYFLPLECW